MHRSYFICAYLHEHCVSFVSHTDLLAKLLSLLCMRKQFHLTLLKIVSLERTEQLPRDLCCLAGLDPHLKWASRESKKCKS